MSSSGLSAGMVWAVGAGCGLGLVVLYLVGRRAVRIVVPFAGPWLWTGRDRAAVRRGMRLVRLGSLLLLLGMLAAIVAAAALSLGTGASSWWGAISGRPGPTGGTGGGRTIVLLLDRSASMQAREPGQSDSRLMRAQRHATQLIAAMAPGDRAVVVAFAAGAVAHTGLESDRARLAAAVEAIEASDEPGDLPGALDFAAALLRGQARPAMIVLGDGGGPDVTDAATLSTLRGVDVRFVPVGERARNLGIVAFSARRQPADPTSADLSLVVQSFQDAGADLEVAVTAGPARIPVARRRLHVRPRARVAADFTGVAVPDPRLEAHLANTGDALALDDRAFALVPDRGHLNVIAIGEPDLYLDGALLSLGPTVAVERVAPGALDDSRGRWARADVVIFNGVTPDAALSSAAMGRFLYIDPDPARAGSPWRAAGGTARDPVVSDVARDHPVVRGLALKDLNISEARRLAPAAGDSVLIRAGGVPLLLARDRARARALALAFHPRRSDLPMRSAFPLFLANALAWLADQPEAEALSWPTGRTVAVGTSRVALERVGFHDGPSAGSARARVAANLASPDESDLTPRPGLRIGGRTPPPPDPAPEPRAPPPRPEMLVLLVALALCAVEWVTYHQRLTV